MEKHDNFFIKKQNKKWVLDIIKNKGPISRADVSKITNMSPTSISRIVQELDYEGFVKETDLISSGVGRKANLLNICDDAIYTIGVDLTEKSIKIVIINYFDEIMYSKTIPKDKDEYFMKTLQNISDLIDNALRYKNISKLKVVGVGISLPGFVDYESGLVSLSIQLGWEDVPVAKIMQDYLGIPILVDNDLKMKAMAEFLRGSATNSSSLVLLGIASGIGTSIITNGEFYRGENNIAGEISHTIVEINGDLCKCGKFGCLATVVTEGAILRQANKVKEVSNIKEIIDYYYDGETWAINIIERVTTYIATTISNIFYLYNPKVLVLSGFILEDFELIQQLIEKKYKMYLSEPFKSQAKIVYTQLGESGNSFGAAVQAQKVLFNFD
ncbi:ROK family transcriptional regulator [Aquibacillus albus]|uniref:NBD/HSP70 family sugar kinase n=1 Tax=Aquibacillus albus TaxID=1168171 RepID=A0ABS2N5R5_9BACI|nr:ROK family transcriptional regulator [Aquibacillus albus]MBM7573453.1 putative NBD/HSP70 family sugar kinase [Aquibacillus albus]